MLRTSFRTLTAFVAFALLLGLHAGSQAQTKPGAAIASGNVWTSGRALQVTANQSRYGTAYFGYVTMIGKYNNIRYNVGSVYVADSAWSKSPDGLSNICTAFGDTTFSNQSVQLVFTWTQNVADFTMSGVAWKFVAYKTGDQPGAPTGAVVGSSASISTVDGSVSVKLPPHNPTPPGAGKAGGVKG